MDHLLVAAMVAGFVLLFPVAVVRRFYELHLPSGFLGTTLLAAAAGVAALTGFWAAYRKQGRGRSQPGAE